MVRHHELTDQERTWVTQAIGELTALEKDVRKAEEDERLTSAQRVTLLSERRRIIELSSKLPGLITTEEVHGNG